MELLTAQLVAGQAELDRRVTAYIELQAVYARDREINLVVEAEQDITPQSKLALATQKLEDL